MTILVPDYAAGLSFYRDILGFDLVEDSDLGGGKRWVVLASAHGGARVLLARAVTEEQRASIGRQAGGRVGFFLESTDFAADHRRLEAAGVPFEGPPRVEAYGHVAVFRDPFGNRWDLLGPAHGADR
ncbi:MAG: VOC family protein [Pseudomonadota bacterium]